MLVTTFSGLLVLITLLKLKSITLIEQEQVDVNFIQE